MELFDIVDYEGNPTGQTVERSTAHAEGIRHRTAHIWIVRKTESGTEVLLQKRAQGKDCFPGYYDTSSSGHITAGSEPLESAQRELGEELGIHAEPDDLEFIGKFLIEYDWPFYGRMFKDREVSFVYVYRKPVDISKLVLQEEEVERVDWFPVEEVEKRLRESDDHFCVPAGGFRLVTDWISKLR